MPLFSIIIPVYNLESYLEECLESVRTQIFTDWECICVDDGSKDASGTIIDSYAAKDNRFKVIHQPNGGISSARNAALDIVNGEWICFVDGDDKILSDYLSQIANVIQTHQNIDYIRLAYCSWLEDGSIRFNPINGNEFEYVYGEQAKICSAQKIADLGTIFAGVLRRSIIGQIHFDMKIKVREDSLFLFEVSNNVTGLAITPINGYLYRYRANSAFHSKQNLDFAIAFQQKFNLLWDKYHFNTKAFTKFSGKNLMFCCQTCPREPDKFEIMRKLLLEAKQNGAFQFKYLSFKQKIKFLFFLYFRFWQVLYGAKFFHLNKLNLRIC